MKQIKIYPPWQQTAPADGGEVLHESAAKVVMTREQQINEALKLIDPPPDRRDQCRGNIEYMLGEASDEDKRTRAGAKEWKAYHLALRRLLATHDKLNAAGWGGRIERDAIKRAIDATTPEQYRRK